MKFLIRTLIILSFLFYSCDETTEIGIDELFSNQKERIKVHYTEIPLNVSNVYYDSVRTDDGDLYFGKLYDPIFGDTRSIGYAQFLYEPGSDIPPMPGEDSENYYAPNDSSIFDSARLYIKYSKVFGNEIFDEQEITVSQIEDTLFSSALYTSNKFTEISPPRGIIGFTRFKVLDKDTFLTVPIKDSYGKFLLNRIISGVQNIELMDQLRGFALIPGESNNQIIGFDLDDSNSKLVLYFNNPVAFDGPNSPAMDSLEYVFRFNSPLTKHYSYYETDRSSSELSIVETLNKNEKFNVNNKVYWQSASGIYPLIDLGNFHAFSDTAENIVLNNVQIVTGPLENTFDVSPPPKTYYYITKENNEINPIGIISEPGENVIMKDNAYYSQDTDPVEYVYDSIISFSYKGESTVFFQEVILGNIKANKLISYPENPNSFNHLVINKDKFYLKVFYTKYKDSN